MGVSRPAFRYNLMVVHAALAISLFLINLLVTSDILLLVLNCVTLLGVLVYVPAGLILSIMDSKSPFTIVRAEVAYLAFQNLVMLATAVISIFEAVAYECKNYDLIAVYNNTTGRYTYTRYYYSSSRCSGAYAGAAISCLSLLVSLVWMGWLIHITRTNGTGGVHKPGKETVRQAFKVPTGLLVKGKFGDDEKYEDDRRMVHHDQDQARRYPQLHSVGYKTVNQDGRYPPATMFDNAQSPMSYGRNVSPVLTHPRELAGTKGLPRSPASTISHSDDTISSSLPKNPVSPLRD